MTEPTDQDVAHERNKELTAAIAQVGRRMGLDVRLEYAIEGGRIDVMWLWNPPAPIPGLATAIPVVGFEIESSWRTRKHVKGDMVNLQDAGVALGVIVLSGADERDEALRMFARRLIDRPGAKILIWTDDDVRSMLAGEEVLATLDAIDIQERLSRTEAAEQGEVANDFAGKYRSLWQWLLDQDAVQTRISFSEIERKAGIELPNSCRNHVAHWHGYEGSAVARAIHDAGWTASNVDLNAQLVTLIPRLRA